MRDQTMMNKKLAKFHARRIGADLFGRGMYGTMDYIKKHPGWGEVSAVLSKDAALACVVAGWAEAKHSKAASAANGGGDA